MKYRKKPVVVEAIQWNGVNLQEIIDFVGDKLEYHICDTAWEVGKGRPQVTMKIKTLEGEHIATEGDYIIKGVHGEFYPCKPDMFEKMYEPATNTWFNHIKAMSIEQMASMLMCPAEYDLDFNKTCKCNGECNKNCIECVIKWLESEVKQYE